MHKRHKKEGLLYVPYVLYVPFVALFVASNLLRGCFYVRWLWLFANRKT